MEVTLEWPLESLLRSPIHSRGFAASESVIFMSEAVYFVDEDAGRIEVPVVRQGTDLSHTSMVWCATRMSSPPSATPGQDYIPHSKKIVFHAGEITAVRRIFLSCLGRYVSVTVRHDETVVFVGLSVKLAV